MNIVSRFMGGAASDKAASSRGMRGRMWVMLILLLLQGVMCLLVGISHDSLAGTVSRSGLLILCWYDAGLAGSCWQCPALSCLPAA